MTLFLDQPRDSAPRSIASGQAGLGDIWRLSNESMTFIDNTNADYAALMEAYDRRISEISRATGKTLDNPLRAAETEWRQRQATPQSPISHLRTERESRRQIAERLQGDFQEQISGLAEKHPNAADRIGAGRPLTDDALGIMRETEQRLDAAMTSRGGAGKWLAVLGGGFAGMMRDPVQLGTLFLGGGTGAAKTAITRIATVAGREVAVNAAIEAALQPSIQARRERAGLPSGFDEALRNVAFAALFGGVFGGGFQAAGEGLARILPKRQADNLAGQVATQVEQIRGQLPAEIRGAVDAAEIARHEEAVRPPAISARAHENAVTRAQAAVSDPVASPPAAGIDAAQTTRIADRIAGKTTAPAKPPKSPASLTEFLIDAGGIRQQGGELQQIGATKISKRFRGRLVKEDGLPLDQAREAAAEAGYFDDRYGTPADAVEKSTVADLIDLIDREVRGDPVYPSGESRPIDVNDADRANRDYVEARIADMQELAGPGIDDAIIARAVELAERDGLDPADAFERAVMNAPELAAAGRTGEPLPGWDDATLEGPDAPLVIETEGRAPIDIWQAGLAEAVAAVKAFARSAFAGKTVTNIDGSQILIPWQGIRKALSGRVNRLELAAALRLDELISGATYVRSEPDAKGRRNVLAVHRYQRAIVADGRPAQMDVVVREHLDGKRYYDHFESPEGGGGTRPGEDDGAPPASVQEDGAPPPTHIGDRAANVDDAGGLDDPKAVDDAFLLDAADLAEAEGLLVPIGDELADAAELMDLVKQSENLANVVEACRI